MRAPRGVDEPLNAISLNHAGRRSAAALACVHEALDQPPRRPDTRIRRWVLVGALNWDKFQRGVAAARDPELEAAKIIGGRIEQDEGAILAVDLEAMTGAEKRRAAHLQTAGSARCEGERQCNAAIRFAVG